MGYSPWGHKKSDTTEQLTHFHYIFFGKCRSDLLIFKIFMIYLFILAALGLCCCAWAFSSCGKQGLISSQGVWASHCGGFSH